MSIALVRVREAVPLERMVEAVLGTVRESDTACRLEDGTIALILEDTPENGAVWTVERLRRAVTDLTGAEVTLSAGVACYPAHALEAEELLARASGALASAQEWPQHRIEIALPE
jgi:diguanylate cyclase (GGDEF)-like protein